MADSAVSAGGDLVITFGEEAIEHHHRKIRLFSAIEVADALEQEKAKGKADQIAETLVRLDLLILDEPGHPDQWRSELRRCHRYSWGWPTRRRPDLFRYGRGPGFVGIDGTAQSGASMSITAASGSIAAATLLSKDDLAIAGNASGGHNGAGINRSGLITSGHDLSIVTANLRNERTVAPTYTTHVTSNTRVSRRGRALFLSPPKSMPAAR